MNVVVPSECFVDRLFRTGLAAFEFLRFLKDWRLKNASDYIVTECYIHCRTLAQALTTVEGYDRRV